MNISDDSDEWDALFPYGLVPRLIALVLDAWDKIQKPAPDEWERDVSERLGRAMRKAKERNRQPFLIISEPLITGLDAAEEERRPDIVVYSSLNSSNDEEVYFGFEARRLNAVVSGRWESLAGRYVEQGMRRFVDGSYAWKVRHGGMLGYVLDGDVRRARRAVEEKIKEKSNILGMGPLDQLRISRLFPEDERVKETCHSRAHHPGTLFWIHHLFLASSDDTKSGA